MSRPYDGRGEHSLRRHLCPRRARHVVVYRRLDPVAAGVRPGDLVRRRHRERRPTRRGAVPGRGGRVDGIRCPAPAALPPGAPRRGRRPSPRLAVARARHRVRGPRRRGRRLAAARGGPRRAGTVSRAVAQRHPPAPGHAADRRDRRRVDHGCHPPESRGLRRRGLRARAVRGDAAAAVGDLAVVVGHRARTRPRAPRRGTPRRRAGAPASRERPARPAGPPPAGDRPAARARREDDGTRSGCRGRTGARGPRERR